MNLGLGLRIHTLVLIQLTLSILKLHRNKGFSCIGSNIVIIKIIGIIKILT